MESIMNHSAIKFYPLTFIPENNLEVTVGRLDIDSFILLPADGAALLQKMQEGLSPQNAADWYMQQYNELIDVEDFLSNLQDLEFIQDGKEMNDIVVHPASPFLRQLGKIAFSPAAWIIYGVLFIGCLFTIMRFHVLVPSYQNIFFSPYFTLVEVGLFIGQMPGILFHELYHIIAGRRLGIRTHLGFGHRLYFLVFETSLTGLWSVPRRSRYLPLLAGMLADIICFSFLTLIAGATLIVSGRISFVGMFCLALAFSTMLRFLWQFYFYLRTDLYYLFTHVFGCIDLQHTTQKYLRNRLFRMLGLFHKMEDETNWYPKDRQVARWYAPLYVLGNLFSLGVFFGVGLPALIRIASGIITRLHGGIGNVDTFWDSCLFLTLNVSQLSLVAIIALRSRKQTRRQGLQQNA
jgi:hypothetical protein